MNMQMRHGLPSSLTVVDPDVVAIRQIVDIQDISGKPSL
jgi:hypothetical protein